MLFVQLFIYFLQAGHFYLLPDDWKIVERYVEEKGLMLLASPSPTERLRIVSSVNPISSSEFVIHK